MSFFRTERLVVVLAIASAVVANAQGLGDDLDRAQRATRAGGLGTNAERLRFEALADEAGEAYRAGDIPRAVERFDQAAAEAFRAEAVGAAFEYALAAAELTRAQGDHGSAAERFRRAALGATRDPRAAAAHEAACAAAAEALKTVGAPNEPALMAYEAMLAEHLATWPDAATCAAICQRRQELLAMRGDWQELLKATQAEPRSERVVDLRMRAYRAAFADAADAPQSALLSRATDELQALILADSRRWPKQWSPLQRDAAVVLGRAHLGRGPEGAEYARRLLRVAWRAEPTAEEGWCNEAGPLLMIASLATGDQPEAMNVLQKQGVLEPQVLLSDLARQISSARADAWPDFADRLRQRLGWQAGEQSPTAAPASPGPSDPATTASELSSSALGSLSFTELTELERRRERGSSAWREARLARIERLVSDGDREAAAKLLRLTRLLAGAGDAAWRERLDTIELLLEP